MTRYRSFWAIMSLTVLSGIGIAADQYAVTYERNVEVKMRDGVTLKADIFRPQAEGKFPVLLQRTPYNKDNGVDFGLNAAARGYDAVEWAAALPYSNGKIGMFGGSYVGATQMLAAIAHPPHLAGICSVVTASNYHSNWTYQGGAFEQWFDENWTSGLAQDTFNHLAQKNTNALNGIWKLPLTSYPLFNFPQLQPDPSLTASLAPYFLDWLAHPTYDDYWKALSIEEHFS